MKKLLPLAVLVLLSFIFFESSAQMDTLLYEDFQDTTLQPGETIFPEGNDTLWVNFDGDGLADANDRPQSWYQSLDLGQAFLDTVPPTDSNFVLASSSWLEGFLDGNRNWLVTPPLQIVDASATLHWKSAPRQGPRYMDGYSVLISTGENFPESFTDTLYRVQQMLPPLPTGASDTSLNAFNVDSFFYAPANAYMHADRWTLDEYKFLEEPASTSYVGYLEPHSVSLADYSGETVYIAFLHDSDDDNYITIDDILVLGSLPVSTSEPTLEELRFVTYPNPVKNYLNVLYRLDEVTDVNLVLTDIQGKTLLQKNIPDALGEMSHRLDLLKLPAGNYQLSLQIGEAIYTKKVIKN